MVVGIQAAAPLRAPRLSPAAGAVLVLARAASSLSRLGGRGGQMIGGRVGLMLRPGFLRELAVGRRIVLVSGTNGKTTTTAMLAAAMATEGPVASNRSGANMLDGVANVLALDRSSTVVAEVDELYLPAAVEQTDPAALVLLNLTRDQLDRFGEIRQAARRLREMAERNPTVPVVANCDDPYVVFVAEAFQRVVWVAAGAGWGGDAGSCPACGRELAGGEGDGAGWSCEHCGLRRPVPDWGIRPRPLTTGDRRDLGQPTATADGALPPCALGLPGRANRGNAAMALAAASALGVSPAPAARAVAAIREVEGRYRQVHVGAQVVRLILAKNPAGWATVLDLLRCAPAPVVIAINADEADGRDTSWLYDVPFEWLAGHTVAAAGRRAADLGVRLSYAEVTHSTWTDPLTALASLPAGPAYFVGDYTSFAALRAATRPIAA